MGNAPSNLHNAIWRNDVAEVRRILEKAGAKAGRMVDEDYSQDCLFRSCFRNDYNAMYDAVMKNRKEIVQIMIANGASVHASGKYGETCLHRAARNNHVDLAKILVQAGCDVKSTDDQGHYVTHACGMTIFDTTPTLRWFLLEAAGKEDVDLRDFTGRTALHEAAHWGNYEVCKSLLEFGADVNAASNEGNVPLHGRGATDRPNVWRLLVDNGADVTIANKKGVKPKQRN